MANSKTVTASTNTLLAGLKRTTQWDDGDLTTYTAKASDAARMNAVYGELIGGVPGSSYDPLNASDAGEKVVLDAIANAEAAWSLVTNFNFSAATALNTADIVWGGGWDSLGGGTIARMDGPGQKLKPGETDDYQSFFLMAANDADSEAAGETGGGSFAHFVVLHEFGHGLGLSHPHSSDLGTTAWAAPGVVSTDNKADNARYTVMSYEIGGIDVQSIQNFGNTVTPSALDIAAVQEVHGTRAAHTGNTTYTLTDARTAALDLDGSDGTISIGRAFYTIWDTGGKDTIRYDGEKNAYINLNEATLVQTADFAETTLLRSIRLTDGFHEMASVWGTQPLNELTDADYHAGGYYSTIADAGNTQMGGFAIAKGVVIENASGGDGRDMLIGNAANNVLRGNAGDDVLVGGAGNDSLYGGDGDDELVGGAGNDLLDGGAGYDVVYYDGPCASYTITRDDETGIVTVSHLKGAGIDGVDTLIDIEEIRFTDAVKYLDDEEIAACPPLDFIFLVDLSGSFSDDLYYFRQAAREIVSDLRADNVDVQFALASFVDLPKSPFGSSGDYLYKAELALTDDPAAFEAALSGLTIFNGNDTPEAQWVGLWNAANGVGLNLREGSSRVIYMATDAPAHTAKDYGLDESTIMEFLETNEIPIVSTPPLGATVDAPAAADSPDGLLGGSGWNPTVRDPADPGHDIGATVALPTADPLVAAVGTALRELSAVPIIGTTTYYGGMEEYRAAMAAMGSPGVVVETTSSGVDIADAIRAGMAAIRGDVTGTGTSGGDTLIGTDGNDVLLGLGGNDLLQGLDGDDSLDGGAGNDTLEGGAGNDTLNGGTGNDSLDGGDGHDWLRPGTGNDTVTGGAGMDVLAGPAAAVTGTWFTDFTREDSIVVEAVTIPEGVTPTLGVTADGADRATVAIDLDGNGITDVRVTTGQAALDMGLVLAVQGDRVVVAAGGPINGTAGNDLLLGNELDNQIAAGAGNDTIHAGGGDDRIAPGAGNNLVDGGAGSDTVVYAGLSGPVTVDLAAGTATGTGKSDTLRSIENVLGTDHDDAITGDSGANRLEGGAGNDWITPGRGNDTVDGGDGKDTVSFVDMGERVVADLGAGTATVGTDTNTLINIENVTGTIWADLITGDAGNNRLRGLGGYDWFVGSAGNDTYEGGSGRDTVSYATAEKLADGTGVHANLRTGTGTRGQAEGDVYDSIESLTGSSHKDWLVGSDEANVLRGLGGDDIIYGYGGNDTIDGGAGNDWLDGGDGNDRITGGAGNDTIIGGRGWDAAIYSGNKADYQVETWSNGWVSILDTRGIDGVDILIDMNVIEFADGKLWL